MIMKIIIATWKFHIKHNIHVHVLQYNVHVALLYSTSTCTTSSLNNGFSWSSVECNRHLRIGTSCDRGNPRPSPLSAITDCSLKRRLSILGLVWEEKQQELQTMYILT